MNINANKVMALLLTIIPISTFLSIGANKIMILFIITLILNVIKLNKKSSFLIGIILIFTCINYIKAQDYINYGFETLSKTTVNGYSFTIVIISGCLYLFCDFNFVRELYINIKGYINIIMIEVILIEIYDMYLLIIGKGFTSRWGMSVFSGTFSSPHVYAYSLIFIVVIIQWIFIEKKSYKVLALYIVPISTGFMTGARTPLIVMLALIAIFLITHIRKTKQIGFTVKDIIFLLIILSVCIINFKTIAEYIYSSNIWEKMLMTSESDNVMNSRDIIWNSVMSTYLLDVGSVNKLIGSGIYYTVIINSNNISSEIWAHSDFIDILISFGAIVCLVYSFLYIRYFYKVGKWNVKDMNLFICISIFVLAMINGLVNYTVTSYIFCYLSLYKISMTEKSLLNSKEENMEDLCKIECLDLSVN